MRLLGVLFALVLTAVAAGCIREDIPSEEKIRESIEESIRPGASVEEIVAYLDSQGIKHSSSVLRTTKWTYSDDYGIPEGTNVLGAGVHGSRSSGVSIIFILDEDLRFERLVTKNHRPL